MFRKIIAKVLVGIMMATPKISKPVEKTYPSCGIIYALEYADDAVIVRTPDGELWEFYGCEDWAVGDICAMTFKDAGIPDYIWDDEIIDVRYVGYIGE